MATQSVKGSLPERIFYKKNLSFGLRPDVDFDFQTSQEGGRLELGGMVADFVYWYWKIIVRIQGPTHTQPRQIDVDAEQGRRMADMGFQVYDVEEELVYSPIRLDEWFRKVILFNPGKNGRDVIAGNTLYDMPTGRASYMSVPAMNFAMSTDEKKWVNDIEDRVENAEGALERIFGKQIHVIGGISDISENLGLIQAGEFRSGNRKEPGSGFTGVRIAYPPVVYSGAEWNIAGVNNDVLQFGLRASDGKALAGGGAVILDSTGVTATAGVIGGWTIGATSLKAGTGASTVGLDSGGTNPAIYAGSATPASAPFRVTKAGAVTATSGTIGGWTISSATIQSNVGGAGIILNTTGGASIKVGYVNENFIMIDGWNRRIFSANFVAGASGFNIDADSGDAEFGHLTARGLIRCAVFEKDQISSIGGWMAVLDSDELAVSMTAADAQSVSIAGNTTFATNDILRMKDGTNDEWLTVTGSGTNVLPLLNVGFETAGGGGADVFANWTEDPQDGSISRDSTTPHGGSYSCRFTNGTTYPTVSQTIPVVAGKSYTLSYWTRGDNTYDGSFSIYDNDNGIYPYGANHWFTNVFAYTWTYKTFTWKPMARCASITLMFHGYGGNQPGAQSWFDDIQITANEYVTYPVTRDAAGAYSANANPAWKSGQAVVNYGASGEGGVMMYGSGVPSFSIFTHAGSPWSTLTNHVSMTPTLTKFGDNVGAAASTAIAIMHSAQTYNSESMGSGDVLFGDNSTSKANMLWDKSAGTILFRGGTTTQGSIDVSGAAMFGGGAVVLNANGVNIIQGSDQFNYVNWWLDDGLDLMYGSIGCFLTLEGSSESCTALILGGGARSGSASLAYASVYMEARGEDTAGTGYAKSKLRLLSAKGTTDELLTLWWAANAGYANTWLKITKAAFIWNDDSQDLDMRFESDGNADMFVLDGGLNCIGIGATPATNVILDVVSTTKAFRPPVMTTTQRNAIGTPLAGMIIWNSTTTQLEDYNGGWAAV
jgi:hypothetical protein